MGTPASIIVPPCRKKNARCLRSTPPASGPQTLVSKYDRASVGGPPGISSRTDGVSVRLGAAGTTPARGSPVAAATPMRVTVKPFVWRSRATPSRDAPNSRPVSTEPSAFVAWYSKVGIVLVYGSRSYVSFSIAWISPPTIALNIW